MKLKENIYVILDKGVCDNYNLDIIEMADKLSLAGADIFQLRAKGLKDSRLLKLAIDLRRVIKSYKKLLIINDRVDIALLSGSDGVHLGKYDLEISEARKILGKDKTIGKTIHSLAEMKRSLKEPVNYLSVGPAFATIMKPDLLAIDKKILQKIINLSKIPVYAIGGITLDTVNILADLSIKNIALCRGVLLSKSPAKVIKELKSWLANQ